MGGINYIVDGDPLPRAGHEYMQMPLTIWGMWLTAILNVLFVPVLGSAALLLILDRLFGTRFFIAGAAVGTHARRPDALPAPVLDLRPPRGLHPHPPRLGHRLRSALVLLAQARLLVQRLGLRDDAPSPCSPRWSTATTCTRRAWPRMLGLSFEILTLSISVPAVLLFVNWLNTIWKGSHPPHPADALRARHGLRLRRRRPDRAPPRHHLDGHLPPRHDVRGRPLPPHDGGRLVPRQLRGASTSGSPRCSGG